MLQPDRHMLGAPSTIWETIMKTSGASANHEPWNKGKIVGQKAPFKVNVERLMGLVFVSVAIEMMLRGANTFALQLIHN